MHFSIAKNVEIFQFFTIQNLENKKDNPNKVFCEFIMGENY